MIVCCMTAPSPACLLAACVCGACVYPLTSESQVLVGHSSWIAYVAWELFPTVYLRPSLGFGIGSSIRAILMYGSTIEMTDVRAMKTCIALS